MTKFILKVFKLQGVFMDLTFSTKQYFYLLDSSTKTRKEINMLQFTIFSIKTENQDNEILLQH